MSILNWIFRLFVRAAQEPEPEQPRFVVCETTHAISQHVREVTPETPVRYGGHSKEVFALCPAKIAWDTKLPINAVTCRTCQAALAQKIHRNHRDN